MSARVVSGIPVLAVPVVFAAIACLPVYDSGHYGTAHRWACHQWAVERVTGFGTCGSHSDAVRLLCWPKQLSAWNSWGFGRVSPSSMSMSGYHAEHTEPNGFSSSNREILYARP